MNAGVLGQFGMKRHAENIFIPDHDGFSIISRESRDIRPPGTDPGSPDENSFEFASVLENRNIDCPDEATTITWGAQAVMGTLLP